VRIEAAEKVFFKPTTMRGRADQGGESGCTIVAGGTDIGHDNKGSGADAVLSLGIAGDWKQLNSTAMEMVRGGVTLAGLEAATRQWMPR